MARIIYGVSGEGSGHASRAGEMLAHLQSRGHDLWAVSYDRGYRDLSPRFRVFETEGLSIATVDNEVSVGRTIAENLAKLLPGHRKVVQLKRELFEGFQPDCVITDFEPMTAYLATLLDLPLVTVDNQHRMRYMEFPCPDRLRASAKLTRAVIRAMVPRPDVSLVTTFYFGPTTNDRTFLFPPILRQAVLDAEPRDGGHLLVYLTHGFDSFLERLEGFPRERCVIYGAGQAGRHANLEFKEPSRDGFLADLAGCKAVLATAGFTLMTEALHLGKPYLALPMKGQFEQELNAILLEERGMGRNGTDADSETVGDFLYRLPEYREQLTAYPRSSNEAICAKLDELLADGCALAREFHRRRTS